MVLDYSSGSDVIMKIHVRGGRSPELVGDLRTTAGG